MITDIANLSVSFVTILALKLLPNATKMATAVQRVNTSFLSHYYSFAKSG